ncbi:hypothetical protein ABZ605_08290 [Streptomyces sp. NPDC012765]|uniref:hypothetical protein n=1 Tax=Streptomyces sp. NPDC012765 TaxID=3155249 RepID=UPI00340B93E1
MPTTRTVTGRVGSPIIGAPSGIRRVVLAPYPARWTDTAGDEILASSGEEQTIADGAWSAELVTTDDATVEPVTGRLWRYEEYHQGVIVRVFHFLLPHADGTAVPITDLIQADPGAVGYLRGPEGPKGDPGPTGPQPPLGAAGAGADTALRSTDPSTTNARTPTAHAASHGSGGADPVAPAAIGAETPAAAQTKADAAQAAAEATAAGALATHAADTTAVHGIADTSALETSAGAQTKANSAQAAAEATAAGALSAHAADTTAVHGITDTSALETSAGAAGKVTAHAAASDPHGDRAWATGQFYPLASGNALNGFLDDALLRIADLETRVTNAEAETRTAVKTVDEPVTNNTLQDDDHLALSVVANGWYEVALYLDVEGDPAADLTMGWTVPAGAALSWTENGVSAGNTNNIGSVKLQRNDAATASGVGIIAVGSAVLPRGVLRVAGTGGTLQFRWAQTSTNATPTILKTGSMLKLTRIA